MKKLARVLVVTLVIITLAGIRSGGAATGYGANGNFLAPIGQPAARSIAISDRAGLEAIKNDLSGNYYLTADIDLSGAEWAPLGDSADLFTGIFDGQGHALRNLTVTGEH